eukprot:CAMPEP_0197433590 /NCGR_PEP_ID=MMETSP1175-20131217/1456_1 /TAXON_ID=1003142 /ORGANISM="Triceratium dubium, Strain CCMP147" /LENGTH=51 /DNA_ID=CAMNT_0042962023 /DNA_START=69 /DNA_END=220 /DNA_ORIENTATION=+
MSSGLYRRVNLHFLLSSRSFAATEAGTKADGEEMGAGTAFRFLAFLGWVAP